MPKFDHVSTNTLEKHKAAIENELKKRAQKEWGLKYFEFKELHSDADCSIETVFVGKCRSGFIETDFMTEVGAYGYKLRCTKHGSMSAEFMDMVWIPGAIDESRRKKSS